MTSTTNRVQVPEPRAATAGARYRSDEQPDRWSRRVAHALPAVAVTVALAGSAAACGGSSVPLPGGGSVKQSGNGKTFTYSNGKGSYSVSGSQQLPSGFPKDVPLPAGGQVSGSQSAGSGSQMEYMVYFTINGDPQTISNAYQAQLQQAGYQITGTTSTDGSYMVGAQGPTWVVEANVNNAASGVNNSGSSGLKPGQSMMELIVSNQGGSSTTTTSSGSGS